MTGRVKDRENNDTPVLSQDIITDMIHMALQARKRAYTPYSHFQVGAALLADAENQADEENPGARVIITGCNIENAAYSPGNCAERTAVFKAVSEGYTGFHAIAIVAGKEGMTEAQLAKADTYTSPCGMCRQVLREFVNPDTFLVIMAKSETDYVVKTLSELFPMSFGPDNLI